MNAPYTLPKGKVVYNLRYFLPHPPIWGTAEQCEQRVRELVEFCHETGTAAVQFYVNTRFGTYYMPPARVEEQHGWIAWMRDHVAPEIQRHGISFQLNFQMLLGASTFGADMRSVYDWEFMVDQLGDESVGCPCPLGGALPLPNGGDAARMDFDRS